jgi:hypothetical protein
VIVRVLGIGQFRLDDSDMAVVERADDAVEAAIAARDAAGFRTAIGDLIDTIESVGEAVPDDEFIASDVIVPDRDISFEEAVSIDGGTGEGLIPGG